MPNCCSWVTMGCGKLWIFISTPGCRTNCTIRRMLMWNTHSLLETLPQDSRLLPYASALKGPVTILQTSCSRMASGVCKHGPTAALLCPWNKFLFSGAMLCGIAGWGIRRSVRSMDACFGWSITHRKGRARPRISAPARTKYYSFFDGSGPN